MIGVVVVSVQVVVVFGCWRCRCADTEGVFSLELVVTMVVVAACAPKDVDLAFLTFSGSALFSFLGSSGGGASFLGCWRAWGSRGSLRFLPGLK